MKSLLCAAVLVLAASIPSYGQMGAISGLSISPMPPNIPILPHDPPANFQMLALSGNTTDFLPSTFLAFGDAVSEGAAKVAMDRERITLVELAGETRAAHNAPAKALFIQDDRGNAILVRTRN